MASLPVDTLSPPPLFEPYASASARTSTTRVAIMEEDLQQDQQPPPSQTYLSFLLVSGRRRTMAFDPETTVGRVKELVWNSWPAEPEWQEERPPAPAYLRILYLGKILQDEDTLSKLAFPVHDAQAQPPPQPTIVHLSVRAYAPPAEDASKPKKRKSIRRGAAEAGAPAAPTEGADGDENAGGCCCVVC